MAYPTNFLRLVVTGGLPGGEGYSFSLSIIPSDFAGPVTAPSSVPAGILTAVQDLMTGPNTLMGSGVTVERVKLNEIGTEGRYVSEGDTVEHVYEPPIAGLGTINLPPQAATAVTLLTSASRGLASKGRFYLPRLAQGVGPDGRLTTSTQSQLLTMTTAFIDSLNDELGSEMNVGVVSNRRAGAYRTVTGVQVGRVVDTMRSRRKGLEEEYMSAPIV